LKDKERLLLITKQIHDRHIGGRELLCKLNERVLEALFGDRFMKFEIDNGRELFFGKAIGALRGRLDGLDGAQISEILQLITEENPSQVFIDGSNLGSVAKALKKHSPRLEVITFYHNVETRFFLGAFRRSKTPKALAVLLGNYLAERAATRFSDKIICLNERDSGVLNEFFGRHATHISPMALDRPLHSVVQAASDVTQEDFALFVGGNFYANLAAIEWFRDFVSPHLSLPLYVVGRGFDQVREKLEIPGKIIIVGGVDDLEIWYRRSKFVVAPIFDGSGMKTKVAEALMYGKKIVGTPEAFVGYEITLPRSGWCCRSPEGFLNACRAAEREFSGSVDQALIEIYEENYSFTGAKRRFAEILVGN
jgi:glycosyltransferase involved in cell wall biosynthesis